MSADQLLQIATMLVGIGAVYGAIRADLRGLHDRCARNEKEVDTAHKRIDDHVTNFHSGAKHAG